MSDDKTAINIPFRHSAALMPEEKSVGLPVPVPDWSQPIRNFGGNTGPSLGEEIEEEIKANQDGVKRDSLIYLTELGMSEKEAIDAIVLRRLVPRDLGITRELIEQTVKETAAELAAKAKAKKGKEKK